MIEKIPFMELISDELKAKCIKKIRSLLFFPFLVTTGVNLFGQFLKNKLSLVLDTSSCTCIYCYLQYTRVKHCGQQCNVVSNSIVAKRTVLTSKEQRNKHKLETHLKNHR